MTHFGVKTLKVSKDDGARREAFLEGFFTDGRPMWSRFGTNDAACFSTYENAAAAMTRAGLDGDDNATVIRFENGSYFNA